MKKPFGATGEFPEGKIGPHDEGALRLGVAVTAAGNVHIEFGKPVAWLEMSPDQAREFAAIIKRNADRAGPQ